MKRLLVLGAGGHGKSVAEAALLGGEWQQVWFLDDSYPERTLSLGCEIVGRVAALAEFVDQAQGAIAAVGNNDVRSQWCDVIEAVGLELVNVFHPQSIVSPSARLDRGIAIMAGAVVGTEAVLARGALVNANATVDHDARLDAFAHLGVGVQIAGGVVVGAHAWLQAGASCGYHVVVPEGARIGPGEGLLP